MGSGKKGKKKQDNEVPAPTTGEYMFANGDKYIQFAAGEYKQLDDGSLEREGQGTHTTPDGTQYTGQWTNDKMNGQGKLLYPSGACYEGTFVNNMYSGDGVYTWPSGATYTGPFTDNRIEGSGEFTDTEGQTWTGKFRHTAAPGLRFKLML